MTQVYLNNYSSKKTRAERELDEDDLTLWINAKREDEKRLLANIAFTLKTKKQQQLLPSENSIKAFFLFLFATTQIRMSRYESTTLMFLSDIMILCFSPFTIIWVNIPRVCVCASLVCFQYFYFSCSNFNFALGQNNMRFSATFRLIILLSFSLYTEL